METAPDGIPEPLPGFYTQAADNVRRQAFDSAVPLFRRILEISLKKLNPGQTDGTLYSRIEKLPPELGITPSMRDWAHSIRELGNEGVHDDEPVSKEAAETIMAFTELFLTYAFSLPAMVKARREPT